MAIAAGLTLLAIPIADAGPADTNPNSALKRPNLLILVTDQERYPQHWPEGWAARNLPNRERLARRGLTFTRAYCNTAMCSPSRASLFTGLYAPQHGVLEVLENASTCDTHAYSQTTLRTNLMNMARMLEHAGYDVQYRGKWHMSRDPSGMVAVHSPSDLAAFGFKGWCPPDASDHTLPFQGGGDVVQNDANFAQQAADFLRHVDPHAARPFALVVCLVNPHDIMGWWKQTSLPSYSNNPQFAGKPNYGPVPNLGIQLPITFDLELNKPACQVESTLMWATALGILSPTNTALDYVNFYAYLHTLSDQHIGTILDALEANRKVQEDTLVFRLADHGEMGLAHGRMREKAYNAYEETIHIPMVISNPRLFPKRLESDALVSLIDVMPTLASIVRVHPHDTEGFRGTDLTPIIQEAIRTRANPTTKVQDSLLFTTDETLGSRPPISTNDCCAAAYIVHQPAHIRCLREENWKFALYFDPDDQTLFDYELYDLVNDPYETTNLGRPGTPNYNAAKWNEMYQKLILKLQAEGINW